MSSTHEPTQKKRRRNLITLLYLFYCKELCTKFYLSKVHLQTHFTHLGRLFYLISRTCGNAVLSQFMSADSPHLISPCRAEGKILAVCIQMKNQYCIGNWQTEVSAILHQSHWMVLSNVLCINHICKTTVNVINVIRFIVPIITANTIYIIITSIISIFVCAWCFMFTSWF